MAECLQCSKKSKEISELKGALTFHQREAVSWRKAFSEQRGGTAYTETQAQLGAERVENIRLRKQIRELTE